MYLCNLQNVSKEHLGKHMEDHALSTEHERKKTWTKEQLLLKDHRPTRALKKMKRENWLIDAYEKTTVHMMGGLTGDHTVVNCNNNEKKKNTKQTSTMCDMRSLPFRPKTLALRPDSFVIMML